MKKALFSRGKIFPITLVGSLCALTVISSCGIYTTSGVLNPPYGQQIGSNSLTFSGNNPEVDFSGYMLWYKEAESDVYKMCIYKERTEIPTIPKDLAAAGLPPDWVKTDNTNAPVIEYTVFTNVLKPLGTTKSFDELNDSGNQYHFAVSSYGTDGVESEKTEFGIWPLS